MEVASSNDVALVEVLDPFGRDLEGQFSFLYPGIWQGDASTKLSLASRKERSQCEKWECG